MGEHRWLSTEEQETFRAFAGAARDLLTAVDRDLQREAGMPRAYFEILYLLDRASGRELRMSDLADATRSQPSRITHAVARLEKTGHVRRELCAADRRGWFAVLTDEGRAALDRAKPCFADSVRRNFLAALTPDDRQELARIGRLLLHRIDGTPTDDSRARRRDPQGALTQ